MLTPGVMGATELLARMIASIDDPHDEGVGADIHEATNGVRAEIDVPGGDRYRVTVEWLGDREASPG